MVLYQWGGFAPGSKRAGTQSAAVGRRGGRSHESLNQRRSRFKFMEPSIERRYSLGGSEWYTDRGLRGGTYSLKGGDR